MKKKCIICGKDINLGDLSIKQREKAKCCSRICGNIYRSSDEYKNKIRKLWEIKFPKKIKVPREFQKTKGTYLVYIYTLIDPISKEVKYIGKANSYHRRYISHLNDAIKQSRIKKQKVSIWIKELLDKNLKPDMEVIEVANESNWQERERYWIAEYRKKGNILNIHKGGTGLDYNEEMRKKKSATIKALWKNPEYRERVLASRKNMYTPELRKKIGENSKKAFQNPETKERHKQSMKETMSDLDIRKRISETLKNTLSTSNIQET